MLKTGVSAPKEFCPSKQGVSDIKGSFLVTDMASVDVLLDTEADDGRTLFYLMYLIVISFI